MKKTLIYSFHRSIPIMLGFFPLGVAFGILMHSAGYNALWTGASGVIVLSGSLQFLMVSFLKGGVPVLTIAVLSLLMSSRHMFYGIGFIEKFRSFHKASKWFLIYSLADENFSLHCAYKPQEGVKEEAAFVITAALVVTYWIAFTMLGALIGGLIPFSTEGIDFSMTALFMVILLDQLREAKSKLPLVTAVISAVVSLLLFGAESFILPSLLLTMAALCLLQGKIEPENTRREEAAV